MIEAGETELDSILRECFPKAGRRRPAGLSGAEDDVAAMGRSSGSGLMASGPIGTQAEGILGTEALGTVPGMVDALAKGPGNPKLIAAINALQVMLRKTNMHFSPPSHQAPPFGADPLDVWGTVSLPGGGYGGGSYTTVCSFTVPDQSRGVVVGAGQALESPAAFEDVTWKITVDNKAWGPYFGITNIQLFPIIFSALPNIFIRLRGGQTVAIQAASNSATAHQAQARLFGWFYQVDADFGDNIRSTLQD